MCHHLTVFRLLHDSLDINAGMTLTDASESTLQLCHQSVLLLIISLYIALSGLSRVMHYYGVIVAGPLASLLPDF